MTGIIKSLVCIFVLLLSFNCICFADQQTTVLIMPTKCAKAVGQIPFIDGSNDENYEKKANALIIDTMRQLVKRVGNKGTFNYSVQYNRPSIVSVLLKAQNNNKVAYRALNIDLTTGQNFEITEFFVDDKNVQTALADYVSFLFTEQGVYLQDKEYDKYTRFVPFSKLMSSVRIGQAGRLFQITKLTRKCANKIARVAVNGLYALKLDSNPTTGYHWEGVLPSDGEVIKVGSSFVLQNQDKQMVGVPGSEILFYTPVKPGRYEITMQYKRGWEKFNVDEFNFILEVTE